MAPLGGNAAGQGTVGVDQVGLYRTDQSLEDLHVVLVVGAVGHAVHLQHLDVRLQQGLLQQAALGNGHQSLKLVPVGVAQVVEDHPTGAADVGVTDDVEYADHTRSLPSGSSLRRAARAPRAR